jgi:hypothetical protein
VAIPLTAYTLLILTRNVVTGLEAVPAEVRESATGMGYGPARRLLRVELPLALPTIIAGVRIATVSTIALVTIGFVAGHGGLGELIIDGLRAYVDYSALTGSEMIHEKGDPSHVGVNGRIPVVAETAAGDKWKTSRVYAAVKGTDELLAIDTTHELNGLEVVGHAHAGSPIDYLGADKTRVYAATESVLVVLAANTFEGYDHGKMTIMHRIHFRDALPASVRNAPLSGLAVGPNRVYLTLQGVPYVLSVAKPSV